MTAALSTERGGLSAGQLAEQLGISNDALRKRWRKTFGTGFSAARPLTELEAAALRGKAESARPAKATDDSGKAETSAEYLTPTKSATRGKAESVGGQLSTAAESKRRKRRALVLFVLCVGTVAQMLHTAAFFALNSPVTDQRATIVLSALYAVAVDCTALIMTVNRGGKGYLWAFALIHASVNLSFHWQTHSGITFGTVLLSFVIAFSNFSYTELFASEK